MHLMFLSNDSLQDPLHACAYRLVIIATMKRPAYVADHEASHRYRHLSFRQKLYHGSKPARK